MEFQNIVVAELARPNLFVSIIIPVKDKNKNLEECVRHCLMLDYPNYEIMVLCDNNIQLDDIGISPHLNPLPQVGEGRERGHPDGKDVTVIPTGPIGPAEKRDMAIERAKGDIIAFLDDDTFPVRDWLKNGLRHFEDPDVAAVGGPAVTPDSDSLRARASGEVYSSFLASGRFIYRYVPKEFQEVDDYPSCNFIVRKSILKEVGGFNTRYWPGEDTVLCLNITSHLKKKIVYEPSALVFHHRRELYLPHLKQVKSYALHRGYFVKKFPQNSLKLAYFIPSIFVAGVLIGAIVSILIPIMRGVYLSCIGLYLLIVAGASIKGRDMRMNFLVWTGIILTHIYYGIWFLKGLLSRNLKVAATGSRRL